jgi:hypothetical protein
MKTATLRVGTKGAKPYTVPVRTAESLEDVQELSKRDVGVVIRCFNRGFRIESQERSGARDAFREGKNEKEIADIVAAYDPTKVVPRSAGPRKPKEVKLVKGKKSYTPEEIQALLAGSGVKNVTLVAAE